MLKRTIVYKDFNNEECKEVFYFHLTKRELLGLQFGKAGGLGEALKEILATNDIEKMLETFSDIIAKSYGVRSEDGKRFIKNAELLADFEGHPAYDALFYELVTNQDAVVEFILGIIPDELKTDDVLGAADQLMEKSPSPVKLVSAAKEDDPPWKNREPTPSELKRMSKQQLLEVMQRKSSS